MGRKHQNVVCLDGYSRLGKEGTISYPLVGYEYVVPARGPLYKRVLGQGQHARVSLIQRLFQCMDILEHGPRPLKTGRIGDRIPKNRRVVPKKRRIDPKKWTSAPKNSMPAP